MSPDDPKLVEFSDLGRLPVWLLSKPLYELAPMSFMLRLSSARGTLDSLYSRRHRDVLEKLRRYLGPERSEAELRRIARRHMEFRRRSQSARFWPQVRDFAGAEAITVNGLEHLDDTLARGKGAILMSAHYGYSRLIKPILRSRGRTALLVGPPTNGGGPQDYPPYFSRAGSYVHTRLLRLPRASTGDERWNRTVGTDLVTGLNLRQHLRALANNETIIILSDGRAAHASRCVSVLDVEVQLASGGVGLARSSGAAALPVFVVDDPGCGPDALRLIIRPALEIQSTRDAKADLEVNLGRFAVVYDEVARSYPHNWHWSWVEDGVFSNPLA